jgi:hypothetical protein
MKEQDYMDMKLAGCDYIYVGVESFSDQVRHDMLKKFNNVYERIDFICYTQIPIKYYIFACEIINILGRSEIEVINRDIKKRLNDKFK